MLLFVVELSLQAYVSQFSKSWESTQRSVRTILRAPAPRKHKKAIRQSDQNGLAERYNVCLEATTLTALQMFLYVSIFERILVHDKIHLFYFQTCSHRDLLTTKGKGPCRGAAAFINPFYYFFVFCFLLLMACFLVNGIVETGHLFFHQCWSCWKMTSWWQFWAPPFSCYCRVDMTIEFNMYIYMQTSQLASGTR